jgi:4-diphosphocytidyl-2-C-methyl-D-erythritol kinase
MLAKAKINLHLHITGRAENGYHQLDSLVAFTSLHDEIQIKPSDKFQLNISGLSANCSEEDNLITRAAHLLAKHENISPHIQIDLVKNIPLAGGLGGGSADAAATLTSLKKLWNISSDDVIESIAASLGSDIVACLNNKPVVMRGTGNTILPAPHMPTLFGVLVNPNVACSTPEVYKVYAQSHRAFSTDIQFPDQFESALSLCAFLRQNTRNDLTEAAITIAPDIKDVLESLDKIPDCLLARLSGSGATCFALFDSESNAQECYTKIQHSHPNWWINQVTINLQ